MRVPESTELADAILSGELQLPVNSNRPYDAPRICPVCERRMVVKISPFGSVSYTHLTLPTKA